MNLRFLAYFDVLGYEVRITKKTLEEELALHKDMLERIQISQDWATKGLDYSLISNVYFSDSFIFYSKDNSDKSFASIIAVALFFMNVSAIKKLPYFPMRGAISYGDFLADHKNKIYIGSALREACRLQEKQDWMGCCLTEACVQKVSDSRYFEKFKNEKTLLFYGVPMKPPNREEKLWCVNMESWPRNYALKSKEMPITRDDFLRNIFENRGINNLDSIKLNEDAERKLKNTQEFFCWVNQQAV